MFRKRAVGLLFALLLTSVSWMNAQVPPGRDSLVSPIGPSVVADSGATLTIVTNGEARVLHFSASDLTAVEADPGLLASRFGVACCTPKRISECVWVCCDGKYYKTCDTRLRNVLVRIGF